MDGAIRNLQLATVFVLVALVNVCASALLRWFQPSPEVAAPAMIALFAAEALLVIAASAWRIYRHFRP